MKITEIFESEISKYYGSSVEISPGVMFSEYRLKRRISLFKNGVYPKGKTTKQGRYKYWADILTPRINSEVKNLRIDTRNPLVFSESPDDDFAPVFISNARLKDWLWETGRAEEFNDQFEQYSANVNLLMKKTKNGYEPLDMNNVFTLNQTAKKLDDTGFIERHQLTQSELRAKEGTWENIDEVIKNCGNKEFKTGEQTAPKITTNPYYEIYERNGEIKESVLFEAQGKKGGDEDKFVLAKIIVAGLKKGVKDHKYILFAEPLKKKISDIYKVAHRGPYKGRFWREGLVELLFDYQVRANEIVNQIASGLEWASKTIFNTSDKLIVQNILTDLNNGDIIKSQGLNQVEVRMQGIDQLIADWNRNIQEADRIANSFEVVRGESLPSGTPFRLGLMLQQSANSLFIFLRQKLGIMYKQIFKEWILPELVKDLKGKDIIRIVGNTEILDRLREMQARQWYFDNLVAIGPHTKELADEIIRLKVEELQNSDPVIKNSEKFWKDILPRLHITITGENMDIGGELETLGSLVQLETDPLRRAWILNRIYSIQGLPIPPPTPIIPEQQIPRTTQSKEEGFQVLEPVAGI